MSELLGWDWLRRPVFREGSRLVTEMLHRE